MNFVIYAICLKVFGLHYIASACIAFCVAVANNFLLNRLWTFREERDARHAAEQGVRFLIVSACALIPNLLILHLFVSGGPGQDHRPGARGLHRHADLVHRQQALDVPLARTSARSCGARGPGDRARRADRAGHEPGGDRKRRGDPRRAALGARPRVAIEHPGRHARRDPQRLGLDGDDARDRALHPVATFTVDAATGKLLGGARLAAFPRHSDAQAVALARASPKIHDWIARYGKTTTIVDEDATAQQFTVHFDAGTNGEVAQAVIDDTDGHVISAWTGPQVAWTMARGYKGAFGRKINDPWIWLGFCAAFLLGLLDYRRLLSWRTLDLLMLLGAVDLARVLQPGARVLVGAARVPAARLPRGAPRVDRHAQLAPRDRSPAACRSGCSPGSRSSSSASAAASTATTRT